MIRRYAIAGVAVATAALLRGVSLEPDSGSPFQAFVLAVAVAGLVGGLGPGIVAMVLGAAIGTYLWVPPLGSFAIETAEDGYRVILFVATAGVVNVGLWWLRRAVVRADATRRTAARFARMVGLARAPTVAPPTGQPIVEELTDRELEVLRLAALGLRNGEIARTLFVSENTVKTHLGHIFAKLGARTRMEAVAIAAGQGFLDRPIDPALARGSLDHVPAPTPVPAPAAVAAPGAAPPRAPDTSRGR